ncbi:hypothetical protein PQX77_020956 [Marasmius sp. AFHP31]|nr:hypothetical protein PQX77_020956 [Marasmius sp. AFHP31]
MSQPQDIHDQEERVENRGDSSALSDVEEGTWERDLEEREAEIERENADWDHLAEGIRHGRMLTDAQWNVIVDELVGPLGDWATERLLERYRDRIQQDPSERDTLEIAVQDMHPQLRYRLESAPPELQPMSSMNVEELRVLFLIYLDAHLNGETAMDFGYFLVSTELRPFLPNRPAIVEVLKLNPDYVEVFGRAQPGDDLNILKSETTSDIPALNLDPRKPGGSRETAIELIAEDESNPESLQNTPFANVVLPRRRTDNPPTRVRLAENPWDVALMDPKKVPWHVRFPPRIDIPLEHQYYHDYSTGAFVSTPFAGQLLERAVEVVSASYNGVMGERAKHLWKKEIKKDWGLITEHNKDGLFALALTNGKGMAELREQILQTPIGPNFDEFNRHRLSHEGPFDYDKEAVQEDGVPIPTPRARKRKGKKAKRVVNQEAMNVETVGLWRDLKSKRKNSVTWDVLEIDSLHEVARRPRRSRRQPRVQRRTVVIPSAECAVQGSSSRLSQPVASRSSPFVNPDPFPSLTIRIPPRRRKNSPVVSGFGRPSVTAPVHIEEDEDEVPIATEMPMPDYEGMIPPAAEEERPVTRNRGSRRSQIQRDEEYDRARSDRAALMHLYRNLNEQEGLPTPRLSGLRACPLPTRTREVLDGVMMPPPPALRSLDASTMPPPPPRSSNPRSVVNEPLFVETRSSTLMAEWARQRLETPFGPPILYYNLRDFEDVGFAELLTAVQVCKAVKKPSFLLPHPIGPGEGSVLGESREAVPLLRGESIVNEFVREEEYGLVDDDEGVADIESGRESSTYSELSSYVSSQADSDDLYQDPSLLPDSNVDPTMTQEDFSMVDSFKNNAEEPLIPDPPSSTLGSVGDTPSEHTNAPLVGPAQECLGRIGAVEELQRSRRRVTALEEEIEGLRAQNEELCEGMHRSQEVDGTNVNQNLSRFLTHNGITVSPTEIPTLLEIAEHGVHAPAGQILGAVAAMTEDHHSQLLCIQAERVESPPKVTNMLRFLVHEASGMSNFV